MTFPLGSLVEIDSLERKELNGLRLFVQTLSDQNAYNLTFDPRLIGKDISKLIDTDFEDASQAIMNMAIVGKVLTHVRESELRLVS